MMESWFIFNLFSSEYESEEEDPAPASRMSKSADEYPPNISSTSQIPESFIEIIHHPHSGQRTSTIISLDNPADSWHGHQLDFLPSSLESQPWAPFRTRSDFEFSEMVVKQGLRHQTISQLLDGFNGRWATESSLTLRNYADYQASLAAARQFTIEVRYPPMSERQLILMYYISFAQGKPSIPSKVAYMFSSLDTETLGNGF